MEENKTVSSVRKRLLDEIERLGNGSWDLWILFIMCFIPGILNGMQVTAAEFIAAAPLNLTCEVPQLKNANFSEHVIHAITSKSTSDKCMAREWDYDKLAAMKPSKALEYINEAELPGEVPCEHLPGARFAFSNASYSIVPYWDLVCNRKHLQTLAQTALSIGKLIGAFTFGVIADRMGRKCCVSSGYILLMLSCVASSVTPWYWLFIVARIGIGMAGSGTFNSTYTILTEFASSRYRSSLSIALSISYPIGYCFLALIAYLVRPWRSISWAITAPTLLLIPLIFLQKESPRWLIKKNRLSKAYRNVFHRSLDATELAEVGKWKQKLGEQKKASTPVSRWAKTKSFTNSLLDELKGLYGDRRFTKRIIVCNFTYFVCSFIYYVTALNGDNIASSVYIYVLLTGLTEMPAYIVPVFLFRCMGRRRTSLVLFIFCAAGNLNVAMLPSDEGTIILVVALFARTCGSAVFAVVILHTAELFPTHLRVTAIGISSTWAHVGSIMAPYVTDFLGGKDYWYVPTTICGVLSLLAAASVLVLPETMDQTLQDIEVKTT